MRRRLSSGPVHDSTIVDSAEYGAEDEVTDVSGESLGSDHSPERSVHDEAAGVEPVGDVSEDGPVAGDGAPVEVGARESDEAEQRADQTEPVGNAEPEVASSPDNTANTTPGRDAVAGDEGPGSQPDTGRVARQAEAAFMEGLARLTGIFDPSTVDLSGGIGVSALAIVETRLTHYGAEPLTAFDRQRVYPQSETRGAGKPHGFWVSIDADSEGWADWCRSEGFELEGLAHKHDVTLAAGARILWLTTPADLDGFTARYGTTLVRGVEGIDWARVAGDWQGIIITPYQWSRRLGLFWYYGWDCASGCIWDVTAIAAVRPLVPTHTDAQEDT